MAAAIATKREARSVAVSTPGGIARQCVVQYQPVVGEAWQRYQSFLKIDQARHCLDSLQKRGLRSRLVIYPICPATT